MVPFTIACGECFFCKRGFYSGCDRSNPNAEMAGKALGPLAGRAVRLLAHARRLSPAARPNICAFPSPTSARSRCRTGSSDEQVLFLSDIFPTGYMAAEFCNIQPGDTVAVWGCGPVGQFAIRSAFLLGAERVIAIDTVPERLALAQARRRRDARFQGRGHLRPIQELTHGRGADACIDAVGTEPDSTSSFDALLDRVKVATFMGTDRPHVLRQAIHCCRNFGTVSIIGVYGGLGLCTRKRTDVPFDPGGYVPSTPAPLAEVFACFRCARWISWRIRFSFQRGNPLIFLSIC